MLVSVEIESVHSSICRMSSTGSGQEGISISDLGGVFLANSGKLVTKAKLDAFYKYAVLCSARVVPLGVDR